VVIRSFTGSQHKIKVRLSRVADHSLLLWAITLARPRIFSTTDPILRTLAPLLRSLETKLRAALDADRKIPARSDSQSDLEGIVR